MRRRLLAAATVVVAAAAVYQLAVRNRTVEPQVIVPLPIAVIGEGDEAVAVGPNGAILGWLPAPEDGSLPLLALSEPPAKGRLRGPALEQARVLGAAPAALRPHIAGSSHGESGVDVELRSGIELRFGDASAAERKWRAAAAVLANPSIEALDYVELDAPSRPAVGGSGHTLPPPP